MDFEQVLYHCAGDKDLVAQFDRLTGSNLSLKGSPLDVAIDKASGRTNAELASFIAFVFEFVWLPLIGNMPNDQTQ